MAEGSNIDAGRLGALPAEWDCLTTMGLTPDLLPVVANTKRTIAPNSKLREIGKVPSVLDRAGYVVGLAAWTMRRTTPEEVLRWRAEDDYSAAVQARTVRALDIDCPADGPSIADDIGKILGRALPMRFRANSGKRLLAFRLPGRLTKRIIHTADGIIEALADGQQWLAAGTHTSGVRYAWRDGLPEEFPTLTEAEFEKVWGTLQLLYAVERPGKPRTGRQTVLAKAESEDPVLRFLNDRGMVLGKRADGSFNIVCPNAAAHTGDSGDTATVYFVAHTQGYQRGHVFCMHAHCSGKTDDEMLELLGYRDVMFDIVSDEELAHLEQLGGGKLPVLPRHAKTGKYLITLKSVLAGCTAYSVTGMRMRYDVCTDEPWVSYDGGEWQLFGDADRVELRLRLAGRAEYNEVPRELAADALMRFFKEEHNMVDLAHEWLAAQRWDGRPRVERYFIDYCGAADTPYVRACGRYLFSALAGRVFKPGCEAPMVPVLVGAQGSGKTRGVKALAPTLSRHNTYVELRFDMDDEKWARLIRGKLIGEIGELRGLLGREVDEIKQRVSRTHEDWVPKYREFRTTYPRRVVLIGTTNNAQFLNDASGERRWLPIEVGQVDVEVIERDRNQLWAEGAKLFLAAGVDFREAEELARLEHSRFKIDEPWAGPIMRWANDYDFGDEVVPGAEKRKFAGFTIDEVMDTCLRLPAHAQGGKTPQKIGNILRDCGFLRVRRRHKDNPKASVWFEPRAGHHADTMDSVDAVHDLC
jgi:hypothetical protein